MQAGALSLAVACAASSAALTTGGCGDDAVGVVTVTPSEAGLDESDASTDATSPEEDAGKRDARAEAGDAGTSFCQTLSPKPAFCADFDDGEVDTGWDTSFVQGGNLGVTDEAKSGPFALEAKTPALVAAQVARVSVRTTKITSAPKVTLSFALFLPKTTFTSGAIGIAALDVSLNHFFTLYLRDPDETNPGPALIENTINGTVRHVLSGLPPANAWTDVTITIDEGTRKVSVAFGATTVLDGAQIQGTIEEATIRLGAAYIDGPSEAFTARYDNVVLRF